MISKFTLKFLTDLHHNNIKPRYHANKDCYKDAGNFEDLVAILLHALVNLVTLKQVKEDGQFDEIHLVKFGCLPAMPVSKKFWDMTLDMGK